MIIIEIPGREPLRIDHVVLDYNGTVAVDGLLLKGAGERCWLTRPAALAGPLRRTWMR